MHLPLVPFLVPFLAAALLIAVPSLRAQRVVSLIATLIGLGTAVALLRAAGGEPLAYALGDWPAPYGILFVADRMAALMVLMVFLLALPALLMAGEGDDARGRHFHPLFQLQLAGLAGAFLTGDLFNLFVFFEILLLASYTLLVHGGGLARSRAGLAYVVLNLVGSALFLVAVAFLYGTLGTLNMADLARVLPDVPPADMPLVRTALAILVGVFLLKAALLPMAFWLPPVYAAATPAVGLIFALLTKVGIVAIIRLQVTVLGEAPVAEGLLLPWLPLLALGTMAVAIVGLFAADRLRVAAANLVLLSSGTLLFGVAFATPAATGALLYYLVHSSFATGGFLLLAGLIGRARGATEDRLVRGAALAQPLGLGAAYALFAVSIAGLPPLSGFIGKLMLMQAAGAPGWQGAWWAALLLSGLGVTLVLARNAALIFWQPDQAPPAPAPGAGAVVALALLLAVGPVMVLAAAPLARHMGETAAQLHARTPYLDAVLQDAPPTRREQRP